MEQTPSPIDRRLPLNDLTPSPTSAPRAPLGTCTTLNTSCPPPVSRPSSNGLQRTASGLFLQRFTLKSRRSAPYPEVAVQPGVQSMKAPNRLQRSGELPVALVKLCSCSWKGALEPSRPRLCLQNTDEHDEYRLLEAMSRRFAFERAEQGDSSEPEVARMAASQELQVHFILEPVREVAVGYVALQQAPTGARQLLHQVYVEPECRRMGFATTALQLILGKTSAVALASPSPAAIHIMEKVGFTDGQQLFPEGTTAQDGLTDDAIFVDDANGWTNFYRTPPPNAQWEDQWNYE